jgi:hypothetical protein
VTQNPKESENGSAGGDESDGSEKSRSRKDKVLHTRVPAVLDEELKRLAENLRVPVSNLVRTFLEDAVAAADKVGRLAEDELRTVAKRLAEEREKLRKLTQVVRPSPAGAKESDRSSSSFSEGLGGEVFAGVLGWQPLTVATALQCHNCEAAIVVGETAYLGVRDGAGPRVVIDGKCLPTKA